MEDLTFRFLDPARYKQIAKLLEEKRVEREAFIEGAITRLREALARAGIAAEVSGRPKHIYSIWNKMRVKGLDFSQLYDLRALRVIVEDVRACYARAGAGARDVGPAHRGFDDYISRPKPNGYRSLHTVVTRRRRPAASRCRSAPARCTSSPSTAWRPTGATKRPAPAAGRSLRPATTTAAVVDARSCWPGIPTSKARRRRGRASRPGPMPLPSRPVRPMPRRASRAGAKASSTSTC